MPDYFWYILAGVVFVVINIVLWFHLRRCKTKGVTSKPAFQGLKKHEKRISKWTNIFIVVIIMLLLLSCVLMLSFSNNNVMPDIPSEYGQSNIRTLWSINFLLLFQYSCWIALMVSLLSPFHKNITLKKRLILTAICCVPLVFGVLYCIFDDTRNYRFYFKFLLVGLFPVVFINWPAILLGKPFVEFFPRLLSKIPLPWFQISVQEENCSESSPKGTEGC